MLGASLIHPIPWGLIAVEGYILLNVLLGLVFHGKGEQDPNELK